VRFDVPHMEDWRKHVDIMGQIYENCHVNIAASHGINSAAGLFVQREPATVMPLYISTLVDESESGEAHLGDSARLWMQKPLSS
jgi:hypothetical protein